MSPPGDAAVASALAYHERTKHLPRRYARALGALDWATQPDPFRRFVGAPVTPLDEIEPTAAPDLDSVLAGTVATAAPLDRPSVSQLLYDSLALSAWKVAGSARWSLRVNPSSGNLHPTEGYLIAPIVQGLSQSPAIYHYAPFLHALERRLELDVDTHAKLVRGLPRGTLLVALSSIHWREAWKYGERAFRYCQHDVGHALAALGIAASALGWKTRLLEGATDEDIARLCGVHTQTGPEAERADCLLALFPKVEREGEALATWRPPNDVLELLKAGEWLGTPAALSAGHHDWPIIDEVARAIEKHSPPASDFFAEAGAPAAPGAKGATGASRADEAAPAARSAVSARRIVRQRRSAVEMDAESRLSREGFFRMLARALPIAEQVPFRALPWRPRVHLLIFVHRVDDVEPGLYFLPRSADAAPVLRTSFRPELAWEPVEGAPAGLDLRLLVATDVQRTAQLVSCHQDIAANGVFAVAMLAELEPALTELGAFMYSRLHWEAGAIGQVLYLGAEAEGLRATGIGCFFDDLVHELLGIEGRNLQSLYHFTVGGPLDDARLRTAPAYEHREEALARLSSTGTSTIVAP